MVGGKKEVGVNVVWRLFTFFTPLLSCRLNDYCGKLIVQLPFAFAIIIRVVEGWLLESCSFVVLVLLCCGGVIYQIITRWD